MPERVVGWVSENDRGAYTFTEPTEEMIERAADAVYRVMVPSPRRAGYRASYSDIAKAALTAALSPTHGREDA